MSEARWDTNITVAMDLERLLLERQRELGYIGEADIDAALSSGDPLRALKDLALADKEREVIRRALARVKKVIQELRGHARVIERNLRKRARVP